MPWQLPGHVNHLSQTTHSQKELGICLIYRAYCAETRFKAKTSSRHAIVPLMPRSLSPRWSCNPDSVSLSFTLKPSRLHTRT